MAAEREAAKGERPAAAAQPAAAGARPPLPGSGTGFGGRPGRYLWLPVAGAKRERRALQRRLPAALAFVRAHLAAGRRVLVHCDDGARPRRGAWRPAHACPGAEGGAGRGSRGRAAEFVAGVGCGGWVALLLMHARARVCGKRACRQQQGPQRALVRSLAGAAWREPPAPAGSARLRGLCNGCGPLIVMAAPFSAQCRAADKAAGAWRLGNGRAMLTPQRCAGLDRCVCVALAVLLAGCGDVQCLPSGHRAEPRQAPAAEDGAVPAAAECSGSVFECSEGGGPAREGEGMEQGSREDARDGTGGCVGGGYEQGLGAVREVSRAELRRHLAAVSACHPAARPSSAMLKQVLSHFRSRSRPECETVRQNGC